jgi:hypothetical protein
MRNDWRTDNWGGYRDISRDPNLYHFDKDLRGHGTMVYNRYRGENFYNDVGQSEDFLTKRVSVFAIIVFAMAVFMLGGVSIWVRDLLISGGTFTQMWWDAVDVFIYALETR